MFNVASGSTSPLISSRNFDTFLEVAINTHTWIRLLQPKMYLCYPCILHTVATKHVKRCITAFAPLMRLNQLGLDFITLS